MTVRRTSAGQEVDLLLEDRSGGLIGIEVKAGAIFVNCDHCGSTYQFEEQPKW